MIDQIRNLVSVILRRPFLLLAFGFDLFLTVLPFFDQLNFVHFMWDMSQFSSTQGGFVKIGWPGGPFFVAIWLPPYLVYIASGLNLYLAVLTFKIILLSFLILFAYLVHLICKAEAVDRAGNLLLFALLNPAVVYVTLIWIQIDIIPAFFVALTFYLLRYTDLGGTLVGMALTVLPALIAVFFVYYAVLLFPAFLLFTKGGRARAQLLSASVVLGVVLGIADLAYFRGWSLSFVSNLNGGGLSSTLFHGLQYFVLVPLPLFVGLVIIIAIGAPLAMHRYGYSESDVLYLVLLLFLYVSGSAGFNNYLWLLPWAYLSSLTRGVNGRRWLSLVALCSPMFVTVFFANLVMGTGYQQGIFYFGYAIFHYNLILVPTPAAFTKFVVAYNALLLASMVWGLTYLFGPRRNHASPSDLTSDRTSHPAPEAAQVLVPLRRRFSRVGRRQLLMGIPVLAVLAVICLLFNANGPTAVDIPQVRGSPVGLFQPTFLNWYYATAVDGVTYSAGQGKVTIYSGSPPIEFRRNLTSQYASLAMTLLDVPAVKGNAEVINSTPFALSVSPTTVATLESPSLLTPSEAVNTEVYNDSPVPVLPQTNSTYSFNGSSQLSYSIPASFTGYYYTFGFRMTSLADKETVLWYIGNANSTRAVEFIAFFDHVVLSFGTQITTLYYTNATPDGWNIVFLHPTSDGLSVGIDSTTVSINSSYFSDSQLFVPGASLRVGLPNPGDQVNYSLFGTTTQLFRSAAPASQVVQDALAIRNGSATTIDRSFTASLPVEISDSAGGSRLTADSLRFTSQSLLGFVAFGKLNEGGYALNLSIQSIRLIPVSNSGVYLIPVFLFAILPYFTVLILCWPPGSESTNRMRSRRPSNGANIRTDSPDSLDLDSNR